jgi:hypothetical protein
MAIPSFNKRGSAALCVSVHLVGEIDSNFIPDQSNRVNVIAVTYQADTFARHA